MRARTLKSDALLLLTAVIWGCAFVAQRVGMDHVGPLTFNGVRFALGALALVPLIRWMERGRVLPRTGTRTLLLGGLVAGAALFLGATFQQWGMLYTTAGKAGFITGLYVVFVPILGLAFRQRAGMGAWLGATLAVLGMYLLSFGGAAVSGLDAVNTGDMLELVCALCFAGHVLVIGWLSPGMGAADAVKLSCIQFAVCSALSLAGAVWLEEIALSGVLAAGLPILYGGLMSVGVAYTLQVVAQRDADASHAAIILSLEAVFAALAGWALLGETLSVQGLLGCGLMLAGMLVSQLKS